jgi:catechol 2,3-dioxygenase-like lactoylglutathione lyase family enzyme
VHLVQRGAGEASATGCGNVDHIAFRAVDLDGMRATLRAAGITFREAVVPRDGSVQIFLHDPDGVQLELHFSATGGINVAG